ncbi:hypothetical protein LXL04_007681 [Taraxacum kok-saghyz]
MQSAKGVSTVHFWAPTFKRGITIANIADFAKPPEKLSYRRRQFDILLFFSNCHIHWNYLVSLQHGNHTVGYNSTLSAKRGFDAQC